MTKKPTARAVTNGASPPRPIPLPSQQEALAILSGESAPSELFAALTEQFLKSLSPVVISALGGQAIFDFEPLRQALACRWRLAAAGAVRTSGAEASKEAIEGLFADIDAALAALAAFPSEGVPAIDEAVASARSLLAREAVGFTGPPPDGQDNSPGYSFSRKAREEESARKARVTSTYTPVRHGAQRRVPWLAIAVLVGVGLLTGAYHVSAYLSKPPKPASAIELPEGVAGAVDLATRSGMLFSVSGQPLPGPTLELLKARLASKGLSLKELTPTQFAVSARSQTEPTAAEASNP